MLALTPAGARLRALLHQRLGEAPEPLARLSPAEQRRLVKILERLLG